MKAKAAPRLLALALAPFLATQALAAPAPRLAETSFAQLAQPLPLPYNEAADAHAAIAVARSRALAAHRLLLVDFGGNWCPDCRILAGALELPDMKPFVSSHFEIVTVDVGRFTKNLDLTAAYGLGRRPAGVPAVVIVDPATGRVLNAGHQTALADARSISPQALADWLAQWAR